MQIAAKTTKVWGSWRGRDANLERLEVEWQNEQTLHEEKMEADTLKATKCR